MILPDKHRNENQRLTFLINRDGIRSAVDFAQRTMRAYRHIVVNRIGMVGDKYHRREFIRSYLSFKEFLRLTS